MTGLAIRMVRTRLGIKQYRLAQELGWPQTTLYRVEEGQRTLSVAEADAIHAALIRLARVPGHEINRLLELEERG